MTPPHSLSIVEQRMPVYARLKGRWIGTYREEALDGTVLDSYAVEHEIRIPGDAGVDCQQAITYRWSDGRSVSFVSDMAFEERNGVPTLVWDSDLIRGHIVEVDERTIQIRFVLLPEGDEVQESIFLDDAGRHRLRTWHWFRAGLPIKRTIVSEQRDSEPAR